MSSIQPTFSTSLDLKPLFGWILIGVVCAAVFYGVTVLQMLFYFQTYPSDRILLKSLVTGIWILDTLSLIFVSHSIYTWLVIGYDDPAALDKVVWSLAAESLCSATVACTVQSFMAYRIYILKPKLRLLSVAIVGVSLTAWGVALAAVINSLTTTGGFSALNSLKKIHVFAILGGVFGSGNDIVIAVTLVTILRGRERTNIRSRTDRIISTLTVFLITNNMFTSFITASGAIAFFASPKTLVYVAINVIVSKAYANTFLSQLNVRESIRGRGAGVAQSANTVVVKSLKPIEVNHGYNTREELSDSEAAVPITSPASNGAFKNYFSRRMFNDEKT